MGLAAIIPHCSAGQRYKAQEKCLLSALTEMSLLFIAGIKATKHRITETQYFYLNCVRTRASNEGFTITELAPTRAISHLRRY